MIRAIFSLKKKKKKMLSNSFELDVLHTKFKQILYINMLINKILWGNKVCHQSRAITLTKICNNSKLDLIIVWMYTEFVNLFLRN